MKQWVLILEARCSVIYSRDDLVWSVWLNLSTSLKNKEGDWTNAPFVTIRSDWTVELAAQLSLLFLLANAKTRPARNALCFLSSSSKRARNSVRCVALSPNANCFPAGSQQDGRDVRVGTLASQAKEFYLLFRQSSRLILVSKLCSGPCMNSFCRTVLKSVQSTHCTGAALQRKHKLARRSAIVKEMTPSEFRTVPW